MVCAVEALNESGFNQTSWLPVRSWTYSGGNYVTAVYGHRFLIAERAKLASLDNLNHLLGASQP
jgi:roadblock/LC7 domain-containing protein